ncbi:MAG TPA: phosphoribosylformylglycinamidine cyclo-ligase, partial [Vicinamibacterales bacterium]|nr:phosphoribosylformylglycinamidine cyclo-ligase [Vicinamibacterales bacterium]
YDVAGFVVGVVERSRVIDGRGIAPGDVLIGLPSSGLHTNGYSLARRIVFDELGLGVADHVEAIGATVGDALLAVHRSYLPVVRPLLATSAIKGMAHITGGGMTDNLPRVLPAGCEARIRVGSWPVPPLFTWLQQSGGVPVDDMLRTFNMGIGLILVVAAADSEAVLERLRAAGESPAVIGDIVPGVPGVRYV